MKWKTIIFLLSFSILCCQSTLSFAQDDTMVQVPDAPEAVLADYQFALEKGRVNPGFYSKSSQKMVAEHNSSQSQMANEAKTLKECGRGESKIDGDYAVVRFPGRAECAPYFLALENIAWKIDLAVMAIAIQFNDKNAWHFVGDPHSLPYYGFAFNDWAFDKDGYVIK